MFKNLGWAQFELARQGKATYEQAEISLDEAIDLQEESASPHCLLAQLLEAKALKSKSLTEWRKCFELGDSDHPDERKWIEDARQRLRM